ncbi:MAG: heme ABC transporter ATP-binding protein, partial [Firmicutes bacterium]|nr:heme ABC transporter ATP-binding protein [Bacillota bacterium]
AIAGLVPAVSGKIDLGDMDITHATVKARNKQGLAYIPEDRQTWGLILDFTLSENLLLRRYDQEPYCVKGVLHRDKFDEKSRVLIDEYDIRSGQAEATIVRSMSGGNQQKAIIAREIDMDTPFIIFVQPTRGLDIGAIENIHQQILAERDKGKAILLISLELDEIMNLADTIGVIYNGQLLKIAPADTLTSNEVGQFMMGVKE